MATPEPPRHNRGTWTAIVASRSQRLSQHQQEETSDMAVETGRLTINAERQGRCTSPSPAPKY